MGQVTRHGLYNTVYCAAAPLGQMKGDTVKVTEQKNSTLKDIQIISGLLKFLIILVTNAITSQAGTISSSNG